MNKAYDICAECLDCKEFIKNECVGSYHKCREFKRGRFDNNKPVTICWKCSRTDCSWMKELKPVPGWNAIEASMRYNKKTLRTANVISCPLFEEVKKNANDR